MSYSIPAIFLAGVLTFASPCVLPLMPIYLATIAGGGLDQVRPGRTLRVATAFVLGFGAVFVSLGALASTFGAWLLAYRTPITLASGVLMLLFGARTMGWLRMPLLDRDVRPGLMRVRAVSSLAGGFVFGAAFGLGWSPCMGPVLAAVLAYAAVHATAPLEGASLLAVYAAGLALPLLLLAFGASHAQAWVKRLRGAIPRLEKVTGLALLGVGLWTMAGPLATLSAGEPLPVAQQDAACDGATGEGTSCGLPEVSGEVGAAGAVPRTGPRVLEFTSEHCPVCERMRPVVEDFSEVCDVLAERRVYVDVATASGRALADELHVLGTPTIVFFDDMGVERARLLGEHGRAELAEAVEQAFGVSCWG